MARYIIENDIETLDGLKGFNVDGYAFTQDMSSDSELMFTR